MDLGVDNQHVLINLFGMTDGFHRRAAQHPLRC